jgi:hypothetical protein
MCPHLTVLIRHALGAIACLGVMCLCRGREHHGKGLEARQGLQIMVPPPPGKAEDHMKIMRRRKFQIPFLHELERTSSC